MQRLRRAVFWLVLLPSIPACLAIWLLALHSPWSLLGGWLAYPAILAAHVLVEMVIPAESSLLSRYTWLLVFLPVTAISYSLFFWPCYKYITTRKNEFLLVQAVLVFLFLCWTAIFWNFVASWYHFVD